MTVTRHTGAEPTARRRGRAVCLMLAAPATIVAVATTAAAQREYAVVPKLGTDHTGHRIDADVFGWNRDFSEMAAVGMEGHRDHDGQHRGELFLLVFDIGSPVPKSTHYLFNHTQAAVPSDPVPLIDVRERLWVAGDDMINLWYHRPKRRHYSGAMFIDTVWDPVEVSAGVCQPWVGFMLTYKNRLRYQQHVPLRLQASCDDLRLTDERLYWAKRDLGVALIRFDRSPNGNDYNEDSARLAVSTAWHLAAPIRILLKSARPKQHPETRRAVKSLRGFGEVTVEHAPRLQTSAVRIGFLPNYRYMAQRMAEDLKADIDAQTPMPEGVHVLVLMGTGRGGTAARLQPKRQQSRRPPPAETTQQDDVGPGDTAGGGAYLDDWSLPP